ncbi:WAT1-related protein [Citrus sinensis]|nr:WAT1-related protein [Citrus sinensis]
MGKVGLAPVIGMMMAECAQVGLMFAGKAAMSDGMSNLVFVFYSNAFASLVLLPASLLFHRSQIPPLTLPILSAFFLLGFLGTSSQFFGYAGIYYSSPTLSTAMLNLVPGFTFILAIIFGMEKLDWKSSSSLAKSVGTIVLITGAFIMAYCKGPHLLMTSSPPNLSLQFFVPQTNWVIGGLLLAIDCVFTSAWLIVQASILKKFSAELIVVFFYCFFVAIQSAILCLVMERDLSSWSLKPGVRLVAVLYSAVFGSAFQVGVCTWCLHRTGPVFVAMFKPLGIVISAVVGTIFLGETVYLGRFIGAAVIVTGFYSVMWGKAKEGNSGGQEDYQEYVNASDMKTLFSIVILSQEHGRHHQVCDAAKKS